MLLGWGNIEFGLILIQFQHVAVHRNTYVCNTSFRWWCTRIPFITWLSCDVDLSTVGIISSSQKNWYLQPWFSSAENGHIHFQQTKLKQYNIQAASVIFSLKQKLLLFTEIMVCVKWKNLIFYYFQYISQIYRNNDLITARSKWWVHVWIIRIYR